MKQTLTEEYREVLKETHRRSGTHKWGHTSNTKYYDMIVECLRQTDSVELLDFGAGWGGLKERLEKEHPHVKVHEYEPARPEVAHQPTPCSFVVCTDVFEHVEPEYIDNFFEELANASTMYGFFTVCMAPALKILSDGRNAHLTVEPYEFWEEKVQKHFVILRAHRSEKFADFFVVKKELKD